MRRLWARSVAVFAAASLLMVVAANAALAFGPPSLPPILP